MKETELNANVRKWNSDNLERKNHEQLSLLPLLICFSGPCGAYPCPNDSRFDLNTSWIDGLARMKYSSWIWGFLATWMTWKGKKGNDEDMERKVHERKWKDMKGCEGKWIEMKGKAMTTNKTNPPPKIRKLYLVLLYWFLITLGLLWGSPLAQVNWCWLCFCLVLFK